MTKFCQKYGWCSFPSDVRSNQWSLEETDYSTVESTLVQQARRIGIGMMQEDSRLKNRIDFVPRLLTVCAGLTYPCRVKTERATPLMVQGQSILVNRVWYVYKAFVVQSECWLTFCPAFTLSHLCSMWYICHSLFVGFNSPATFQTSSCCCCCCCCQAAIKKVLCDCKSPKESAPAGQPWPAEKFISSCCWPADGPHII